MRSDRAFEIISSVCTVPTGSLPPIEPLWQLGKSREPRQLVHVFLSAIQFNLPQFICEDCKPKKALVQFGSPRAYKMVYVKLMHVLRCLLTTIGEVQITRRCRLCVNHQYVAAICSSIKTSALFRQQHQNQSSQSIKCICLTFVQLGLNKKFLFQDEILSFVCHRLLLCPSPRQ